MGSNLYKILSNWAEKITQKYSWLEIKMEFSEVHEKYLVSFSPSSYIDSCDEFNEDAMHFEDEMNNLFGNEAPLFCDEESLFKLSKDAEVYPRKPQSFETDSSKPYSWHFESKEACNSDYEFHWNSVCYPLAA